MRVMGNPYNPKCAEPALKYEAPLLASYQAFGIKEIWGIPIGQQYVDEVMQPLKLSTIRGASRPL